MSRITLGIEPFGEDIISISLFIHKTHIRNNLVKTKYQNIFSLRGVVFSEKLISHGKWQTNDDGWSVIGKAHRSQGSYEIKKIASYVNFYYFTNNIYTIFL